MNAKIALLVIAAILIALPLFGVGYVARVTTIFMIYLISVMGLNIIIGYTGQGSLAQGAFFGLGAYTTALLMLNGNSFWLSLVAAIILVAIVSCAIGLMTLRLRGAYFAIATLLFNVIIYEIVDKWDEVTRGPRGLFGIPPPSIQFSGFTFEFQGISFYYLVVAFLGLMFLLYYKIVRSAFGSIIVSIRENDLIAEYSGINITKFKVASFVFSAIFASVAGSLYAVYLGTIFPEVTHYIYSFSFLTAAILGGLGTLAGPFIGTLVITTINEAFFTFAQYSVLIQGIVLILVILYMPRGVMGSYYSRRRAKGKSLPKSVITGKL